MIQALPRIAGTIAGRPPTVVSATIRPSKVEPMTEACDMLSPTSHRPAGVERREARRQTGAGGRAVEAPGATTTAFFVTAPTPRHGSAIWTMLTPAIPGFSGWAHGSCSRAATRIRSPASERSCASCGTSSKPSAEASAMAYHMPPNETSTVSVPSPSTSSGAASRSAKQATFVNSTLSQRPFRQAARTSTTPAGASSRTTVSGSCISTRPVSSSTVATQIVFDPDIAGYSVGSMMMKPASQSGRVGGTSRFAWTATDPRGSRSRNRRSESSARSACICSNTVAPGGGGTPSTTTLPTSPPAWQPTTVMVRRSGIGGDLSLYRPQRGRGNGVQVQRPSGCGLSGGFRRSAGCGAQVQTYPIDLGGQPLVRLNWQPVECVLSSAPGRPT